jgi:predicted ribonuclease YlaK
MLTKTKIKSIKEVDYSGYIYTPEVNKNANYFVGEGTPILSKNCQNISISGMKLILTRVGENCKVFILGDTQQIDSKFQSERNNGLTHMMNLIGTQGDMRIVGIDLTKTIRSKIAGWAAENL